MTKKYNALIKSGVACAALGCNAVVAQDDLDDLSLLEEVVVTAERIEAVSLQETPIAVTAHSKADLQKMNIVNFSSLGEVTPGLVVGSRPGGGPSEGNVVIRGIGVDSSQTQQGVGIYVDDAYFSSRQGNLLGLLDVERVEVLRGPQGTLFGRNTIAGAIQYVTKAPSTEEVEGYVTLTGGNFERRDVEAAVNIPLSETVAVRIAGLYNERDGYVHDILNDVHRGASENSAARVRLLWEPTEDLAIDMRAETVKAETNGSPTTLGSFNPGAQFATFANIGFLGLIPGNPFGASPSSIQPAIDAAAQAESLGFYATAGYNDRDEFQFDFDAYQFKVAYDVSDAVSLKSITTWSESNPRLWIDFDKTPAKILEVTPSIEEIVIFTQEFQAFGSLADNFIDYTAGLYYYDEENNENPNQSTILGIQTNPVPNAPQRLNTESYSAYARVGLNFTDQLTLDLGWRYTNEEITNVLTDRDVQAPTQEFTDNSPYIGLNYKATDDVFVYAKASKGFRAGGSVLNANLPDNGNLFDPEESWSYELGARIEFPDIGLRINPTLFYTEWDDIQFNQLSFEATPPAVTALNAGDAEIQGIEIDMLWAATQNLQFTANFTYTDAEYTETSVVGLTFPDGYQVGPPGTPNGAVIIDNVPLDLPLQRLPEITYNIGGRYSFEMGDGSSIVSSLNYSYVDDQISSVTFTDFIDIDSYSLLTGRIQYNAVDDRFSVALFGTNLTDEEYFIGGNHFEYTVGNEEQVPGRPREYGVEVSVNF